MEKPVTESCVEFLVSSLTEALGIKRKQAAGLLMQDNLYLKKVMRKGVKKEFQGVRTWLQDVYRRSEHLASLLCEEPSNSFPRCLSVLSSGLSSTDIDVRLWTCKLLSKLTFDLQDRSRLADMRLWLYSSSELKVLTALCEDYETAEAAVDVLVHAASGALPQLFVSVLKITMETEAEYLRFVATVVKCLLASKETAQELRENGVCTYWADLAFSHCAVLQNSARLSAFSLLFELWMEYYANDGNSQSFLAENLVAELKVKCAFSECVWVGALGSLASHEEKCVFHPDRVQDWKSVASKVSRRSLALT